MFRVYISEFDLDSLRASLDERGLDIATRQEASLQSRKELATYTKDFKKTVSVDIFKAVAPLLKKYQTEVDALTQRSKQSEASFLDIFQKLQDAPDPSSILEESLDAASKIASLESKLAKVTTELSEYEQESKELKNQDFTIRKLEEKIRAQQELLEEKDQEIEEARSSAAAELEARSLDEAREREERLEKELSRAKDAFETMKKLHASTQAQLVAVQERGEEVAAAAQSESQLAMMEVERAEQRLGELIKERDALLAKVQSPSQTSGQTDHSIVATSASETKALRDDLKSQREFALRLREELEEATVSYRKDKDALEAKIASLQMNLDAKESHVVALEAQLSSRPRQEDLQESRKQIRMLKAILQNSTANEDDVEDDGRSEKSDELNVSSMESALLEKNQKLESSLTLLRMQLAESNDSLGTASARVKELEDQLSRKDELIKELEEHLESATKHSGGSGGSLGVQANSQEDSQSIVQALSAQRDRLKSRINELEGEISSIRVDLHHAKDEAKHAKEDNITLVERLKYVEGYMSRGSKPAIDIEKGGDSIEKYMREYEKKMNPFTDFKAREKEARRRKLPIHDRAAYAVGSAFVSGSKIARSAIITYVFALHFVAFIVIAGFSHRHTEKLDALETLCHEYNLEHQGSSAMEVDPVIGTGSLP